MTLGQIENKVNFEDMQEILKEFALKKEMNTKIDENLA